MSLARIATACLCSIALAGVAYADDAPITRRDGFLRMWETIRRPAEPAWTRFDDVPEHARGSLEIDYAAERGIIDVDASSFLPDAPLHIGDALVWLFRTRNITDDPAEVASSTLSTLLERYPIADANEAESNVHVLIGDELETLIRLLDAALAAEEHEVSLYAEKFHGKGTAFGETFDMHAFTAAHRSFPHNTLVRVTNVSNGKSVVVRINDRGPFVHGRDMDLSLAAFTAIEDRSRGKFMARFERLGDASLVEQRCEDAALVYRRISSRVHLRRGIPSILPLGEELTLRSSSPFVVRGIQYPDGTAVRLQDFIFPDEFFSFTPSQPGRYGILLGSATGKTRTIHTEVQPCDADY